MKNFPHRCELKLLMCEPNPLRPDRVTVGFVLRDTNPESPRVEMRFAKNLQAVRCIYPDADIDAVEETLNYMRSVLENVLDVEQYLQNLPADFPMDFALLSKGAVLTESMEKEVEVLEEQYLKRITPPEESPLISAKTRNADFGRAYLLRKMNEAFRATGIDHFVQSEIPVEQYTFKGDSLAIDFSYADRDSNRLQMMHAVSVVANMDRAKILALSWPLIRDGVAKAQQQSCEMLAVIEDAKYQQSEKAQAAMSWMRDSGIRVEPVSAMTSVATRIRGDLEL